MDLATIKPKRSKQSDKYSWNLYQFLKKNPHYRVYWMEKDRYFGNLVKFGEHENNFGEYSRHIVIGYPTIENKTKNIISYSGAFLNDVLRKPKTEVWSFLIYDPNWFTDITDWFMNKYVTIGRCAFDPDHTAWLKGDEDRWIQSTANTKKCRWCGEWFEKQIEKEVEIKRYTHWVSQKKLQVGE